MALTPAQEAIKRGLTALLATHGEPVIFNGRTVAVLVSRRGETLPILATGRNPEADIGIVTLVQNLTEPLPDNRSEFIVDGLVHRVVEVRKNAAWIACDLKRFE